MSQSRSLPFTPRTLLLTGLALLGALLLVIGGFAAYQLWPRVIDTSALAGEGEYRLPVPEPGAPQVELGYFVTGQNVSPQAFIFSGGSLLKEHTSIFSGVVVRHPEATFLFEGGIGSRIAGEFERNFSGLNAKLFAYEGRTPALEQLRAAGLAPSDFNFVLLTHLHWDHAGIIKDFPQTPIRLLEAEYEGAVTAGKIGNPGFFPEQYMDPAINWDFVKLDPVPFGPFERSKDIFGDGTAVLVELGGHTAGSLGLVLTRSPKERYFFIGDVSWSAEAVSIPAEKTPFARSLVDRNREETARTVALLHEIAKANPGLAIVPSHDATAFAALPRLAAAAP